MRSTCHLAALLALLFGAATGRAEGALGYYRFPALGADAIVFTAEGDLWRIGLEGGRAERLTSHAGFETRARLSPDGAWIAFSAQYEGPTELYRMPSGGGLPERLTWDGSFARSVGWTPDGRILYATDAYAGLPDRQLVWIDPATRATDRVPLRQAADGSYDESGKTLYFTRLAQHGSNTKRYRGGAAQNIWRFEGDDTEAVCLTSDWPGRSHTPMYWQGRVYFVTDRDGWMNLWSMNPDGKDLRQHTKHSGWDVKSPALGDGRIVYQLGADLWLHDIRSGADREVPVTLMSDLDQRREHWIDAPMDWVTASHLSPDGDRVVMTARGQVFVAPVKQGRFVDALRQPGVRARGARFLDGETLSVLSDQSSEVEVWTVPSNGIGEAERCTQDGRVLRIEALPSPDGKRIAYHDKDQELWIWDRASKRATRVATSTMDIYYDLAWSADSRWLVWSEQAENFFQQLFLYDTKDGERVALTTDRANAFAPAWDPEGNWIYFLSDRELDTVQQHPWGTRQPEPYFDRTTGIYAVPLRAGLRSPFLPADELHPAESDGEEDGAPSNGVAKDGDEKGGDSKKDANKKGKGAAGKSTKGKDAGISIETAGLAGRIQRVAVDAGNYGGLATNGKRLFFTDRAVGAETADVLALDIGSEGKKPVRLTEELNSFELSADGEKLLLRKEGALHVIDASSGEDADLSEAQVDLSGWKLALNPHDEWRQMFVEAWRLERDYFYDRGMHGVDWPATRDKYLPLVDRVTERAELADILGEMIGELSALHMYVYGGEFREGADEIDVASLGARMRRDEAAGGWRVEHIYRSDPDEPGSVSPLLRPQVELIDGDVIESINGVATLSVPHPKALLRDRAGKQVRLGVNGKAGRRNVLVEPISGSADAELRYDEWEYTRRLEVDRLSEGKIGYVHLRAMGASDYEQFARDFYPEIWKQGLILDARHNGGGSIESWILEKLMRRAWMWWQPRVGRPYANMQLAYIGKLVLICDEYTVSDGEIFTEGFRRLGLGKVLGTRTLGGEIWLTSSNTLVDSGIATAAEFGVYGPEGAWLIEGHGVDPDIVVDNPPHESFERRDAQLEAAVKHLQEEIAKDPPRMPAAPAYPNKAWR